MHSILQIIMMLTSDFNHEHHVDDGIMISLGDRVIPNHGLVTVQDIGVDPTGTNLAVGLSCSTTSDTCCSDFPHSADPNSVLKDHQSGNGSWLYPSTRFYVPRQVDRPDYIFGISRSENAVYVFRNRDENQLFVIDGIWRCVIPDSRGREQTKYIGVYSNEFSNGKRKAQAMGYLKKIHGLASILVYTYHFVF